MSGPYTAQWQWATCPPVKYVGVEIPCNIQPQFTSMQVSKTYFQWFQATAEVTVQINDIKAISG